MIHAHARLSLVLSLAASSLSACALKPPVRSSGPAVSHDGIALAVVQQRCEQTKEPDWQDDLVEVLVRVQLHNPTSEAATVQRTDFRLIGDERFALRTLTWGAAEPVSVPPGSDRTFELRFMARGAVECRREMRLDAGGGVVTRNGPVRLPAVTFLAERA
jgi:hypothetical protein